MGQNASVVSRTRDEPPTMLKILQLIPTLDRSGAEKQMALLAAELPRDRFQVEVATLTRLGPLEEELRAAAVPVLQISKSWKLDPWALRRLARLLKSRKYDVVHTWIFAANTYGRIAAHLAGVPVVVTSEMAVDLWKTSAHLRIDRWLARWTDRIIGNSQAVVDFYRDAGLPTEKLVRIYSGIGDERPPEIAPSQTRQSLGITPEAPVILFAGRLAPQKGLKDLIDAKQGKLNREQALFAAIEKPVEELYNVIADPDEVHNLATDLKHKKTLNDLRTLVDGFVAENDKRVQFEDPLDIYRGYYKRLPEDPA